MDPSMGRPWILSSALQKTQAARQRTLPQLSITPLHLPRVVVSPSKTLPYPICSSCLKHVRNLAIAARGWASYLTEGTEHGQGLRTTLPQT